MYKLPYFTEEDGDKVIGFIKENPFAIVTGFGETYPVATHLPLAIEIQEDGKMLLHGHLMKNTDHHKAFEKNEKVLVVFNGPHTYVSASWYSEPKVASTWNYMAVHVKGSIQFTDEAGTYRAIEAITNQYEGMHSPASFHNIPADYIDKLIKAIVGFTVTVTSIENVFKLSQNHTAENRESIRTHLKSSENFYSKAIADHMENN